MSKRDFLALGDLGAEGLLGLLERAAALKQARRLGETVHTLRGKILGMIFEKASTRTRVSFEVAICELGGHAVELAPSTSQIARGEPLRDTARVLGRHVAAVGVRTHDDAELAALAAEDMLPVFNMLTQGHHPCQALADLLTLREAFGALSGLKLAYVGDGNNVARSLVVLGGIAGIEVVVSSPEAYALADVPNVPDPREAVAGAHAVYTDVWVSMGDEDSDERRRALAGHRVDDALLDLAAPGAIALHDLPAHVGEEITAEVLYGERQRIWDQAENRRHAQKALLEWLLASEP
jgi:ornithine carbamoyltransferase